MNRNVLLLLLSIIAIIPIFLIKKYILENNLCYILLTLFLYILLTYLYILLFRKNEVSSNYVILQIIQILMVLVISFVFMSENITVKKIIGVIFGIICIYLLY
jgi:multidrug transporter EmrE-like cation transporter